MGDEFSKVYYLAGPMTGIPEFNFPAFERVTKDLRAEGFTVRSAHEVDFGETAETRGTLHPYHVYLQEDIRVLLDCHAAFFLDGWEESRGARLEYEICVALAKPTYLCRYIGEVLTILEFVK